MPEKGKPFSCASKLAREKQEGTVMSRKKFMADFGLKYPLVLAPMAGAMDWSLLPPSRKSVARIAAGSDADARPVARAVRAYS